MAQVNWEVVPRPHQQVTTMISRQRNFTRMNSPTFYGSKVDEYPQEFVGEVPKILGVMGFSTIEKIELAIYQIKDVALAYNVQLEDNSPRRGGTVT